MLRLLKKRVQTAPPPPASVADGTRWYAIGDVHGCLDELNQLLGRIADDDDQRGGPAGTILLLGDLVDRGPDSRGVLDRLIALAAERPGTRFLMGNHDQVFLRVLEGDERATIFFARNGGRETALSYGMDAAEYDELDHGELAERLAERVPAAHRAFIAGFEPMIESGDYLFVHAGIRPGVPLADQRPQDLYWIREPFLSSAGEPGRVVVHGHTIAPEVEVLAHRIGIDTGAYETGRLTALGLEGEVRWFLETMPRNAAQLRGDSDTVRVKSAVSR